MQRDSEKAKEREEKIEEREQKYIQEDFDRSLRREKRIIRSMYQPLMPSICTRLYQCLFIFTGVAALIEVISAFRYKYGFAVTFSRMVIDFTVLWNIMGSILLVCSVIQLVRIKRGYREKEYFFADEHPDEDLSRCDCVSNNPENPELILYSRDPEADPQQRYIRYILTSAIGILVFWAILFLFV